MIDMSTTQRIQRITAGVLTGLTSGAVWRYSCDLLLQVTLSLLGAEIAGSVDDFSLEGLAVAFIILVWSVYRAVFVFKSLSSIVGKGLIETGCGVFVFGFALFFLEATGKNTNPFHFNYMDVLTGSCVIGLLAFSTGRLIVHQS